MQKTENKTCKQKEATWEVNTIYIGMMSLPLGFQKVDLGERTLSFSLVMMLLEHQPGTPGGHIPPVKGRPQLAT